MVQTYWQAFTGDGDNNVLYRGTAYPPYTARQGVVFDNALVHIVAEEAASRNHPIRVWRRWL